MMRTLKLTVNETHTRLCLMPQERLDVRGDTIRSRPMSGNGTGSRRHSSVLEEVRADLPRNRRDDDVTKDAAERGE